MENAAVVWYAAHSCLGTQDPLNIPGKALSFFFCTDARRTYPNKFNFLWVENTQLSSHNGHTRHAVCYEFESMYS